jgi:hypothetical protein
MRLLGTFVVVVTLAGCSGAAPSELGSGGAQSSADSTTSHVAHGADQTLSFSYSGDIQEFGKGLWEGFVSFDAAIPDGSCFLRDCLIDYTSAGPVYGRDQAFIVDATGAQYALTPQKSIHFDRLPLPVKLVSKDQTTNSNTATLKGLTFEVTRTNPIPAEALSGKFDVTHVTGVRTLGSDIPGVALTFATHSQFYKNFTNGNACDNLVLTDHTGAAPTLDPTTPSQQFTLIAPVVITSHARCISSRLATPENANADFDIDISSISLGDPQ